ncbi:hypothetical protein R3X25_09020 [Lutibacter sp. TH_r2]|uniref:hypothetical protein n=1 Tax=Lutibacter sp. TH_r2 TaxID=3082083 RepID=UPI00295552AC|nr:hypothetical protein [Lutibacter sp. TH_r2]MDV7187420.1 hypothetical protein [Lutibacter sp. TH_r2]
MNLEVIKGIKDKINPTEIYNEGWMTRLLVYYSIEEKLVLKNNEKVIIDFSKIQNWTSEALISSPFVNAKINNEGYTHADITLGEFSVDYSKKKKKGKLTVNDNANNFGIIEAKMGSSLSKGTKNAPDYNQAARNVACIAENTYSKNCDIFFYVVVPESKLKLNKKEYNQFYDIVNSGKIIKCIEKRIDDHNKFNDIKIEYEKEIVNKAKECKVGVISYESWIEQITDENVKAMLDGFYEKCKTWNNIK